MKLSDSITSIKGIGKVRASLFSKLGVSDVGALFYHFPRTYTEYPSICEDISAAKDENVALFGKLLKRPIVKRTKRGTVTTACLIANNEKIDLVWFNLPYIVKSLSSGGEYVYYGRLLNSGSTYKIEQPVIIELNKYKRMIGRPLPIYPLTKDLKNSAVLNAVENAFSGIDSDQINEYLTEEHLKENDFLDSFEALYSMHFPDSYESLKKARRRLVFDEFFNFFMQINASKKNSESIPNTFSFKNTKEYEAAIKKLPFTLTNGQLEALEDIKNDLYGDFITQRMIQADVGSGKTVLAFLSMLLCTSNGYKTAIMTPTEVLASQHYNTFLKFKELVGADAEVVLLTGKMSAKEKKSVRERLAQPGPVFIVGTHALIQKSVNISDLALVVVDEQHRFGVKQRKTLSDKGGMPFSIVMSATPIPRSLAMILYGDMNITIIKDVPKKRLPIKNCVLNEDMRTKAYQFLVNEINKGHQAYVICPLVETSEKTEAESVTEYYKKIRELFPERIKIAALHGKMDAEEKNNIMSDFSGHKTDILVSTTVIEVGIDVPNSTVMLIENAGRFGLSQLHQLRGRVGRGESQSYCIFMDEKKNGKDNERLKVISSSSDGFFIANEDLKLRGPGELYGIRQSGDFGFALGDIYTDTDILMLAKKISEEYANDSELMSLFEGGLCRERLSWNNWYNI